MIDREPESAQQVDEMGKGDEAGPANVLSQMLRAQNVLYHYANTKMVSFVKHLSCITYA